MWVISIFILLPILSVTLAFEKLMREWVAIGGKLIKYSDRFYLFSRQ